VRRMGVGLVVLAALLVGADRLGAALAGRAVASRVQVALGSAERPDVAIGGFPFLTQAAAGRFEQVRVRAVGVPVRDGMRLDSVDLRLTGARRDGDDSVVAERVEGRAVISWSALAAAAGVPEVAFSAGRTAHEVTVSRRIEVRGISVELSGRAELSASGSDLRVRATSGALSAAGLGAELPAPETDLLSFTVSIEGLPGGVQMDDVLAQRQGLVASISGTDVRLDGNAARGVGA